MIYGLNIYEVPYNKFVFFYSPNWSQLRKYFHSFFTDILHVLELTDETILF
jgi:hypothetical protein